MLEYQGPIPDSWVTFKLHASVPPCRPRLKAAYNATFRGLLKPTNIPQPCSYLRRCLIVSCSQCPAILPSIFSYIKSTCVLFSWQPRHRVWWLTTLAYVGGQISVNSLHRCSSYHFVISSSTIQKLRGKMSRRNQILSFIGLSLILLSAILIRILPFRQQTTSFPRIPFQNPIPESSDVSNGFSDGQ